MQKDGTVKTERNTKQKQAIYHALTVLDHPSATEVYEYLHGQYPSISRGTVFSALRLFSERGKARRLTLSDGEARYDDRLSPHAHARCRKCNRIFDVTLPEDDWWKAVSVKAFTVDGCEVELTGTCEQCAKS